MATQTIDFSTIETVTFDGISLTQYVVDGTTAWTSAYLGLQWQPQDPILYGDSLNDQVGNQMATDLDGTRIMTRYGGSGKFSILTWNGVFWETEFGAIGSNNSSPKYWMNSAGDVIIEANPTASTQFGDQDHGRIARYTRVGSNWTLDSSVTGGGNNRRVGQRGAFMSGDESVFMYSENNDGWRWRVGFGSVVTYVTTNGINAACNHDGSVVAWNDDSLTRNGFTNAGEVQVFTGAVGQLPTTQKGAFITGTENDARLGGTAVTSSDSSKLALDASGDRLAAYHAGDVRVYDFVINNWVLTNSLGLNNVKSFQMSSDGLSMLVTTTGSDGFLYEELTGVWTLAGTTSSIGFQLPSNRYVMSYDKSTVIAGNYTEPTNGVNAGALQKYKLI